MLLSTPEINDDIYLGDLLMANYIKATLLLVSSGLAQLCLYSIHIAHHLVLHSIAAIVLANE